jgi:hypothetical protein
MLPFYLSLLPMQQTAEASYVLVRLTVREVFFSFFFLLSLACRSLSTLKFQALCGRFDAIAPRSCMQPTG